MKLPTITLWTSNKPIDPNGCRSCGFWLPPDHSAKRGPYCKLAAQEVFLIKECTRRDQKSAKAE